jgi:hypothetical protein
VAHTKSLWEKSTKKNKGEKGPDWPTGKGARNAREAQKGMLLICAISPDMANRKPDDPIYTAFAISFRAFVRASTASRMSRGRIGMDSTSERLTGPTGRHPLFKRAPDLVEVHSSAYSGRQ